MKTGSDGTIRSLHGSSVGGLVLLVVLAGAIRVVAAFGIVTNFPLPDSAAWEGAVDPSLYRVYGGMTEALLPVAIVCAVSLLCTAVWLLATGAYPERRR